MAAEAHGPAHPARALSPLTLVGGKAVVSVFEGPLVVIDEATARAETTESL